MSHQSWKRAGWPLVLLVLAYTGATGPVAAANEDKVFTIGNYPVEASGANAVAAKEKAIADGQQAAFRSLLKRIVPVTAYGRLAKLRSVKASDLVEGFSVRSERNSTTDYIATYDVTFQAEGVRRLLDRENIPFFDRAAPQITILPLYVAPAASEGSNVFSDARGSDAWLYAWKSLDLANTLTPASLDAAKRVLPPDLVRKAGDGNPETLRAFSSEFQAPTLIVAVLEPDVQQKRLKVTLAGRDAVAGLMLRRVYRFDGQDLAYASELAAVVSLGVLEGRWKAINVRGGGGGGGRNPAISDLPTSSATGSPRPSPESGSDGLLRVAVEFRNMAEWQQISRQLAQTPDIQDLDVEGLSGRGARVSLRFPGGMQALGPALEERGLLLRQQGGAWVVGAR